MVSSALPADLSLTTCTNHLESTHIESNLTAPSVAPESILLDTCEIRLPLKEFQALVAAAAKARDFEIPLSSGGLLVTNAGGRRRLAAEGWIGARVGVVCVWCLVACLYA